MKFASYLCCAFLLIPCTRAKAFVDAATLFPTAPTSSDTVGIEVRAGYCDGFLGAVDSAIVVRNGDAIDVLLESDHEPDGACNFPVFNYTFTIGTYPPGNYAVTTRRRFVNFFGQQVVQNLGTLPLAVNADTQLPVVAVPTLRWPMSLFLVVSIAALGARRSAKPRSQRDDFE